MDDARVALCFSDWSLGLLNALHLVSLYRSPALTPIPMQSGLEKPGVLDAFAYDQRSDRLVLAMFEPRPWTSGDAQAFQLQEKLNAYASFVLDGEMREAFPEFAKKRVCIQLRTMHEPDDRTLNFIQMVREQLAFQEIDLETVLVSDTDDVTEEGNCGSGCGCH